MDETTRRNVRNVIVFALADGDLNEQERRFIEGLRARLGLDADEFRALVEEVRKDPKRLTLPRRPQEVEEMIRLLAETARADGKVGDTERRLLRRLAEHAGLDAAVAEGLISPTAPAAARASEELEAQADEIYAHFAAWDESVRREKIAAVAAAGSGAVEILLRVLESYRVPDGAPDALELKALVAEQLGRLGDVRAVYYLAQQINVGELDDEVSNAALRQACAEALGRLVGRPFTRDAEGVEAARKWWFTQGIRQYDTLLY